MWDLCGMERSEEGLRKALDRIPEIRQEFWTNVKVSGEQGVLNQNLEHAGRVADFIELAELMCVDALHRNESCGGHFRAESQTPEGEALRDDENFAYVAAWEYTPDGTRRCCTARPSSTSTSTSHSGATSEPDPQDLAAGQPRHQGQDGDATTSPTSRPTCPSSRCSTCSTRS